jgi:hypothetical protein
MKILAYPLSLILIFLLACSEDHDPFVISECMTQKIEEFKSDSNASAVIQINTPFRKLFWFQLSAIPVDIGENLFTDDCEWYCNFGCYCLSSARCDEDLLRFPVDTVWRK